MKIKKTIAAISAAALAVSAMSVAVLADVSDTDLANPGVFALESTPAPRVGGPTVDGLVSGTGSAEITDGTDGVDKVVNVTLTPADGSTPIAGSPQQGSGTENYHVVIPIDGIADGWVFDTENGSQYDFDEADHTYNIDDNTLKLWLPITADGTYTIIIKSEDGSTTKKIVVNTTHGTVTPVETDPVETDPEETTTTTEATEPEETTTEATEPEETTTEATETEEVLPPSAGQLPSLTPGSSSSGSSEAPSAPVASVEAVSGSKDANVTVSASEAPVSAAVVSAFVKNDSAKTMTVSCGSTLKIAVDKEDVSDAEAANLDFSMSGKNFLSKDDIEGEETLSNATKIVQLDFVSEGKIEGVDKVTVKSKVGVKLAGKTVTIFEYKNGKLVKVGVAEVTASGYVKFKTNHLGKFVLAVE